MHTLRDRILFILGKTAAVAAPAALLVGCGPIGGDPCLESGQDYTTLTQGSWKAELQEGGQNEKSEFIVCAPRSAGQCAPSEQMSEEDRYAFGERVFGPFTCSGGDHASYSGNTFCGPLSQRGRRDECCYVMSLSFGACIEGRPFIVEGEVRLAEVSRRDGWCEPRVITGLDALSADLREEVSAYWAQIGAHEHASVASFARFAMDLMSLGAPRELVSATTRAMEDESRHAHHCFSIASAYAGVPLGPGPIDVAGCMDHAGDLALMLRDAIVEGCVGETLAASVAAWSAGKIQDVEVAAIVRQIAAEEEDHAMLAWQFVDWALTEHPALYEVAQRTFEEAMPQGELSWLEGCSERERALLAQGCVSEALDHKVRYRAMQHIIAPCAQALLERHRSGGEAERVVVL